MLNEEERCWYCGVVLEQGPGKNEHPAGKTLDHIHPKSKGGRKKVLCCKTCNREKADLSLGEYRAMTGNARFWGEETEPPELAGFPDRLCV